MLILGYTTLNPSLNFFDTTCDFSQEESTVGHLRASTVSSLSLTLLERGNLSKITDETELLFHVRGRVVPELLLE